MTNVVAMHKRGRPRTYTSAEAVIEEIRERIHMCGMTYKQIAEKTGVAPSTVGNIAMGHTKWPRPTTFFPLLVALRMKLYIESPNGHNKEGAA
jgi:transcriptional regulator with XRE-family HTH domain